MTFNGYDLEWFWKGCKENCQQTNMASATIRGFSCVELLVFSCSQAGRGRPALISCSQNGHICSSFSVSPLHLKDWLIHTPRQFAVNLPVVTFGSLREVFLFSGLHVISWEIWQILFFLGFFFNLCYSSLSQSRYHRGPKTKLHTA